MPIFVKDESIDNAIKNELKSIQIHFKKDELAYLALTSKIELPIRDKIAFRLHKILNTLKVAREWNRTDLVILDSYNKPIRILELKAMYTFDGIDIHKEKDIFPKLLVQDFQKNKKLLQKETKCYSLLLATHPSAIISKRLQNIVKYSGGINNAFNKYRTSGAILNNCKKNIKNKLSELFGKEKIIMGTINAGRCWNNKVEIIYWLIGPYSSLKR
ncbi:MAG: hypothetical protein PHO02_06910 [Candidatus Nanoarchaeia archaeon]|nr:hypothetical protein [Candidatus Nanoarchaeia archaeon]